MITHIHLYTYIGIELRNVTSCFSRQAARTRGPHRRWENSKNRWCRASEVRPGEWLTHQKMLNFNGVWCGLTHHLQHLDTFGPWTWRFFHDTHWNHVVYKQIKEKNIYQMNMFLMNFQKTRGKPCSAININTYDVSISTSVCRWCGEARFSTYQRVSETNSTCFSGKSTTEFWKKKTLYGNNNVNRIE